MVDNERQLKRPGAPPLDAPWSVRPRAMRNLTSGVEGIMADPGWKEDAKVRDVHSESNPRLKPRYVGAAARRLVGNHSLPRRWPGYK